MTTPLQELIEASDTLLAELVERHRATHEDDQTSLPQTKDWSRKGKSHFKDNKWYKNSDPPKKGK